MNGIQQEDKNLMREAEKEAQYFDKLYNDADQKQARNGYLVPQKYIDQVTNRKLETFDSDEYAYSLLGDMTEKLLLDYGAGDGWNTICFAKAKAKVVAIDISEKGVELIKKKARANGVNDLVVAKVQNCYRTEFKDNTFDLVFGGGILHHLDITAAASELSRILKPEGVAIFREPIRENAIMDHIKHWVLFILRKVPSDVTEAESPLTSEKIGMLKSYFKTVNFKHFEVLSSASMLWKSEGFRRFLLMADYYLMNTIPIFKKLGRTVIIELRDPIKT